MTLKAEEILQNRYRIVSPLQSGGMGAVYHAWDTRLSLSVALKEMTAQPGMDAHTLSKLRDQFRQEATLLAPLDHPNLADVTDFFEQDGNVYLVMRLIEGESLAERIERQGAMSEEQVLTWADQLLDALTYCHSQGVLHRDIKPRNVIIRPDERATLVDFGLVKLWNPKAPETEAIVRGIGTPEYAPPEQYSARGSSGHTDPRTDVYSLGATLYHALIGQAPPTATQRIVNPAALTPARTMRPKTSSQLDVALMKALELQPDARFQSAAEMKIALKGAAPLAPPPRPLTGTRVMTRQPAAAKRKRIGKAVLVIVLIAILLAGAVLLATWLPGILQTSPPTPTQVPATSTSEPTSAPTDTPLPTSTPQPIPTETPAPTETPTPSAAAVVVADDADLRPGASTWWRARETLPAGTELELDGYDPNFADWVYIRTVDGTSSGWVQIADLEINRELDDLPLITPIPTLTPETGPATSTCATGPLVLDTWSVGTACISGGWTATIFAEGRGGNCAYTYAWEGVVQAGPIPGSTTFEVSGGGAIAGTVAVTSGDQIVTQGLYIPAPDCD